MAVHHLQHRLLRGQRNCEFGRGQKNVSNWDLRFAFWDMDTGTKKAACYSSGNTRIPLLYLEPEKSGLKAEVVRGQANQFTFKVKSQ